VPEVEPGEAHSDDISLKPVPGTGQAFFGDVFKLMTGTMFALAVGFIATPIETRFYSPSAYGVSALFASMISIVGVVACLRYELAIPLPKVEREASSTFLLSIMVALLLGAILLVPFIVGASHLAALLHSAEIGRYLWLVPVAISLSGIQNAINYWNTRHRRFGLISLSKIIAAVTLTAIPLGAIALGKASADVLVLAQVASIVTGTIVLGIVLAGKDRKELGQVRLPGVTAAAVTHRRFPIFNTGSALLNSASWQLPSIVLSSFFSTDVVGYYSLGFQVVRLPMSLVGASIGQVFYQRAAAARHEGTLDVLVGSVFHRLVRLSLWPMVLLAIASRPLFVLVFGSPWEEAGVYSQIMALWSFFWFISSPMSLLFSVLDRQEIGLAINIAIFATRLASLAVGGFLHDARLAILLFSLSGIGVYGYLNVSIMIHAGVRATTILRILGREVLRILPLAAVVAVLVLSGVGALWLAIVSFAITVLYALVVLRAERMLPSLRRKRG